MGKLHGMRDDIVHEGLHLHIQTTVLDYLAGVYSDALLHTLKLSPRRVAHQILATRDRTTGFPKHPRSRRNDRPIGLNGCAVCDSHELNLVRPVDLAWLAGCC